MSELDRVRDKAAWAPWRETLLKVLTAWNRHQVWKILTAIVVIWIVSGTVLHFAERGTNLKACLLIGLYRGEAMVLNPVGGEAGPLREGDELVSCPGDPQALCYA